MKIDDHLDFHADLPYNFDSDELQDVDFEVEEVDGDESHYLEDIDLQAFFDHTTFLLVFLFLVN